jgi:acyl-CoA oxidase
MQARLSLARATTIAIRYTSIRRQFENRDAPPDGRGTELPSASRETPVIDYPTVRIRLFPLLATTYALHYSGKSISEMYWQNRRNVDEKEDFSLLSELHLTTSGLKSLCTDLVVDGIETCRRALGGHGFSASSGFITLNNDYHSRPTVEGDNWMITQQVAKGLLKMAKTVVERPASLATSLTSDNLANYWKSKNIPSENVLLDNDMDIVRAFARRAACLVRNFPGPHRGLSH